MCAGCDAEDDSDEDRENIPHHPNCQRHKPTLRQGSHGLADEHIGACKWCKQDIRAYIQVKPNCKWLKKQLRDRNIVALILHFLGHRLAFEQTSKLHYHGQWRLFPRTSQDK